IYGKTEESMMPESPTVFVIDDDEHARMSVCALVQSMGMPARGYASAEQFLDERDMNQAGCVVTDVRLAGMSGVELQEKLKADDVSLPVIVITAFARTSTTVRAMQNGALTVLEKPYRDDELWDGIRKAVALDDRQRATRNHRREVHNRIAAFTPSQYKVMDMIVAGKTNKAIARALDVSVRTVESRRREVYSTMQASSVAELVRMLTGAGILE
ncbi:MAG: response regulator, partial [Pirellulales bacterium]